MAFAYLAALVLPVALAGSLSSIPAGASGYSKGVLTDAVDRTAADSAREVAPSGGEQPLAPGQVRQLSYLAETVDAQTALVTDRRHLIVPRIEGMQAEVGPVPAELAVDPEGRVIATSYESRYPVGGDLQTLVPDAGSHLSRVLAGTPARGEAASDGGSVAWSLHPIVNAAGEPIGAVYVQASVAGASAPPVLREVLVSALLAAGLLVPVGALIGVHRLAAEHARTEERDRIARELHDSVSQDLFALRMTVGGMEARHAADATLRAQLHQVGQSLTATTRQVRALLLDLRPPVTTGLDLASALHELAASYRSRLALVIAMDVERVPVPDRVRDGLLVAAREALANAARHAAARRIEVGLRATDGAVELRVADDGRGFDPASGHTRGGLGLRLLEERAAGLGGTLGLDSGPGRGTVVVVTVPR
jgi:NarL family two-component system sensor histidine kinase LiaS